MYNVHQEDHMIEVSIAEARRRLPELLRLTEGGEQVVVTRRGKPVACLQRHGEGATMTPRFNVDAVRQRLALMPKGPDSLPTILKMRREAR
jgi:antitoxin (DNA-binding transcriptional repressor) of toxin-antitoxin stability system